MTPIAPARREARTPILRAVGSGRADLPAAVARARDRLPDERDRALAAEIATGTLRWRAALDAVIAAFARGGLDRLDPEVLDILRLAVYQLLHLERVPPSAVVSDAVELARASGKGSASGLVNAVLRRVDRERHALPLPPRPGSPAADRAAALDYLAVTLSHPRWLVERWLDRFGFEAVEAWLRFNNQPAPLTLRANTLFTDRHELARRLAEAGVETEPTRLAPDGLLVVRGNPIDLGLADGRWFTIQDEASQLVGAFASAAPGERVLDACAAPGGKSLAHGGRGWIAGAGRGGRPARPAGGAAGADAAPLRRGLACASCGPTPRGRCPSRPPSTSCCSTPRARASERSGATPRSAGGAAPRTCRELAAAQRAMLEQAAAVVRPGGRLVYATCSSEPEENEDVVASFLSARPDFEEAGSPEAGLAGSAAARRPRRGGPPANLAVRPRARGVLRRDARARRAGRLVVQSKPTMALSTRVWSAGKLLLLVVALATTYVLSAVVAARLALDAREVRVPAIVGTTVNAASGAVGDLGLALKVEEARRVDPKMPAGRIARRTRPPGASARRGRSVRVWLSSGQRAEAIPRLVGRERPLGAAPPRAGRPRAGEPLRDPVERRTRRTR